MRRAPTQRDAYQESSRLEILTTSPVCGEWMNWPPPTYMPSWPRPSKNTMSPGCSWLRSTGVPTPNCAAALCGSETPCCAYTYMTKPEQSKPDGSEPPQRYGVPRYCIAVPTTPPYCDGG